MSPEQFLQGWAYVAVDNVFVGIKETGYFQHSSLTAGGLGRYLFQRWRMADQRGRKVTSAGLIEVKDGLVTSLSPLSGHYRCVSVVIWTRE